VFRVNVLRPLNSSPHVSLYVTFLEKSVVGADLSEFLVIELVVVLELEILSAGKGNFHTRLNLGLLGGLPHQRVLGVQGAGEGSGASVLLLQVKLLVPSSVRVHLHDNPLGLGADVLGAGDGCARVGECRRQRSASGRRTPQIWCL
jgi:hypothetical protein